MRDKVWKSSSWFLRRFIAASPDMSPMTTTPIAARVLSDSPGTGNCSSPSLALSEPSAFLPSLFPDFFLSEPLPSEAPSVADPDPEPLDPFEVALTALDVELPD